MDAAVPLARHAYTADNARNAARVGGIKAARTPRAGMLVPLGADGRFPPSVAARGRAGARGAEGPQGPVGPKGDPGPAGMTGYEIRSTTVTLNAQSNFSSSISCTAGQRVVGGGISNPSLKIVLSETYPQSERIWAVGGTASAATIVTVYAVCVAVP